MELGHLLELPAFVPSEIVAKRYVEKPDLSKLTEQQALVFDEIIDWLHNDEEHPIFLLKGYAGTGKTFMTAMVMEYILTSGEKMKGGELKMTAPTNKAVKVMYESADYQHVRLDYRTLHSLLGLKEKIDGYGRITFEPEWGKEPALENVGLVVIDEGSMLPDVLFDGDLAEDRKYNAIVQHAKIYGFKILIVGDPCQIPPVGKNDALVFTEEGQKKYKIRVAELTQIVRQAADNPIIKITMAIRNALGRPDVLPLREDDFDPNTNDGVYFLDSSRMDFFKELLKTYFSSENFKNDANFMKVVCWRNDTIKTFNTLVRALIYGKSVGRLVIGEKLIANKPIFDQVEDDDGVLKEVIIFSNNDEMEIVDLKVSTVNYKGAELFYYDVEVKSHKTHTDRIKIIHDDSQDDLQLIRDYLKGVAIEFKKGSWEAADAWKNYYAVDKFFADVNYNYAISAHKSQGSTYENVLVMETDIDANRKVKERNRIKYTAFSRGRHKLFVAN